LKTIYLFILNSFIIEQELGSTNSIAEELKMKNKQLEDMKHVLLKVPKPNLHTISHILKHIKV